MKIITYFVLIETTTIVEDRFPVQILRTGKAGFKYYWG